VKLLVLLEVDPESDDLEGEDLDDFYDSVTDGLSSVDMEGAIAECLQDWFVSDTPVVTAHDVREVKRQWRVQVELDGKPAKFYVEAEDKDAAKSKVQDQLGASDFVFTRTYELPWWRRP
jgi:hypothetical protein